MSDDGRSPARPTWRGCSCTGRCTCGYWTRDRWIFGDEYTDALEWERRARRLRTFVYSDRVLLVLAVVASACIAGYAYARLLAYLAGLIDRALG